MEKITNNINDIQKSVRYRIIKDYFFTYKCFEKFLDLDVSIWRYPETISDSELRKKWKADTSYVFNDGRNPKSDVSALFDILRCEDIPQVKHHSIQIPRDIMKKSIGQLTPKYQAVIFLKMYPEFVFNKDFSSFLGYPERNYDKILDEIKKLEIRKTINSKKSWYYLLKKSVNKIVESLEIAQTISQPDPEPKPSGRTLLKAYNKQ